MLNVLFIILMIILKRGVSLRDTPRFNFIHYAMSEIKGDVYCIVDKRTKALFEVCATLDVALNHCKQECYQSYIKWGFEIEVIKRSIWIA